MMETIIQEALKGNRKNIARCLSLLENNVETASECVAIANKPSAVPIIGITGPPGAGKSSLVDAMLGVFDQQNKKVAVLCIDPSSPFHSGALLGDRIRMNRWHDHPNFYIRSLSSRGTTGGLHPKIKEMAGFLKQCPFDIVLLETVGVGQSEVDVAKMADCKVLVLVPEAGDEIQFMKSGLMEVADIFAVNKSDRPGADLFAKRLKQMSGERPVIKTSALHNEGITTLIETFSHQIHK